MSISRSQDHRDAVIRSSELRLSGAIGLLGYLSVRAELAWHAGLLSGSSQEDLGAQGPMLRRVTFLKTEPRPLFAIVRPSERRFPVLELFWRYIGSTCRSASVP